MKNRYQYVLFEAKLKGFFFFKQFNYQFYNVIFDCVCFRDMYDELTQNENTSQYEDILKKGSATTLIRINNLFKSNSILNNTCR